VHSAKLLLRAVHGLEPVHAEDPTPELFAFIGVINTPANRQRKSPVSNWPGVKRELALFPKPSPTDGLYMVLLYIKTEMDSLISAPFL